MFKKVTNFVQRLADSHKTRFSEWPEQGKQKAWGFKPRILFCSPLFLPDTFAPLSYAWPLQFINGNPTS